MLRENTWRKPTTEGGSFVWFREAVSFRSRDGLNLIWGIETACQSRFMIDLQAKVKSLALRYVPGKVRFQASSDACLCMCNQIVPGIKRTSTMKYQSKDYGNCDDKSDLCERSGRATHAWYVHMCPPFNITLTSFRLTGGRRQVSLQIKDFVHSVKCHVGSHSRLIYANARYAGHYTRRRSIPIRRLTKNTDALTCTVNMP